VSVTSPARPRRWEAPGVVLVALAAALWGTDGVFRFWLAVELPATVVVFLEHVVLAAMTLPFLVRVGPALRGLNAGDWVSVILVGAGASVLGTVLFTMAFSYGDPNTPLLLQKLQPVFAVLAAALILGERLTSHYWRYFVAGIAGAYLISFPDLTPNSINQVAPALLALGAAVLWGLGTVLGRRLTEKVPFTQLTALRFGIGMPVAALAVALRGEWPRLAEVTPAEIWGVAGLALVPGFFAIMLYYRGLGETFASTATLAELAFPVSALILNWLVLGRALVAGQVVGAVVLVATITAMGLAQASSPTTLGVRARRAVAVGGEAFGAREALQDV
jgi:DME family drug/metabolite transporter